MAITKVVPICLDISSEILDPHMEPLRKRQTGCFSMNYWFALHIPHIWLANSLECFFTFSFFSLPSFSVVSGRVSQTNIRNHTNTFVSKGTLLYYRSFLTIFPMFVFEINTEDVYIFLTNQKYQYDQGFLGISRF